MHILYVTDGVSPWVVGGMQAVARRHVGWLTEAGFQVTLIVSRTNMPTQCDFASRVINIPWPSRPLLTRLDPNSYVQQLKAFSRRVSDVIRDIGPDLIYAEGPLVADHLDKTDPDGTPVIFHPHGLEMFQRTGSLLTDARLRPMRNLVRQHAARARVTISQGGQLDGILSGPAKAPAERIVHLPNCTPAGFDFARSGRAERTGRFLFVGRKETRKGLPALLSAMRDVPGAPLDVVGLAEFERPGIVFHGEVKDREALRGFYDKADFLVVPSLAEGMPTVILEAFAAALPVIATDVGAIAALVRNGQTGLLVPRANQGALVKALQTAALMEAEDWRGLSARSLELARTDFAPDRVRGLLMEIVQKAMGRGETAAAALPPETIKSVSS
jgi:glycosyltransferase involved in cell wall biosynthesis